MTEPRETFDESESPIPLRTMGDIERALARVIRQLHKGSLGVAVGHSMVIALGTLAKVKRESVDLELAEKVARLEERLSQ